MKELESDSICERGELWIWFRKWKATWRWGSGCWSGFTFRGPNDLSTALPPQQAVAPGGWQTQPGSSPNGRHSMEYKKEQDDETSPFSEPPVVGFGSIGRSNVSRNRACSGPVGRGYGTRPLPRWSALNTGTSITLSRQTGGIETWQSSTDNWATTNDMTSADNPLPTGNLTTNTVFRAVVTNGVDAAVYSTDAAVSVDAVSEGGTAQAGSAMVCSGTGTTIGLSGQTGAIEKWQSFDGQLGDDQ